MIAIGELVQFSFCLNIEGKMKKSALSIKTWASRLIFGLDLCLVKQRYKNISYFRLNRKMPLAFSQYGQDLLVLPFLRVFNEYANADNRRLIIFDIGANDPVKFSNTWLYEQCMSAKVYAFEPQLAMKEKWQELRPNAIFEAVAIGEQEGFGSISCPEGASDMFSEIIGVRDVEGKSGQNVDGLVPIRPLSHYLERDGIDVVDFISIDVEGYEMNVLEGIDFGTCRINSLLIENNRGGYLGSNTIRDYLIARGFIYIGRVGPNDDFFISTYFSDLAENRAV